MSATERDDRGTGGRPSRGKGSPPGQAGGLTLRSHLVLLVLAVLLPSLLVGGATAWRLAENSREAYRDRLADTVRALSLALDSEIGALATFASTLAGAPAVARRDLAALRPWLGAAAGALGTSVIINEAAPGFPQVLNTSLPEGAALPAPIPDPERGRGAGEVISRALASGRPAVSDLFVGRASGRPTLAVVAPLPDRSAAVVVNLPPARLSRLLAGQVLAGDAIVAIADGNNVIVARSRDADRYVGRAAPGRNVATATAPQGLFEGRTSDGTPALYAYRRLAAAPGWSVVVAEPLARYRAGWVNPLLGLAAGAAAALLLSLLLATILARRIGRPVEALVARVEGTARSAAHPSLPPAGGTVEEFRILGAAIERSDAALREREAEFRAAFEQAAIAMSQVEVGSGRLLRVNPAYCALLGRPEGEIVGRPFSDFVHPEDRDGDLAGFRRLAAGEAPLHDAEKRYLRPDGSARLAHVRSSLVRDAAGRPVRTVAIAEDVTERRAAEGRLLLMAREVDHRAKNILAVVQAAVRLTPRTDAESYARAIEGRVRALAGAHNLLAETAWSGASLLALVRTELGPFLDGGEEGRITIEGPDLLLAPSAAQPLSMVLHELSTNATKYGALSSASGRLAVAWSVDAGHGPFRLDWTERDGPTVEGSPTRRGFGSRVIRATVRDGLRGTVEERWDREGLSCRIVAPAGNVLAASPSSRRASIEVRPVAGSAVVPAAAGASLPALTGRPECI